MFVDCLEDSALIDPAALRAAAARHARTATAVVPVHLYGQSCDMDAIQDIADHYGLAVVEDACQAHGATYKGRPCGSMGAAAAFSFYPGKNLGALGDGGAVTTGSAAVAERLRCLRNHGQTDKYTHPRSATATVCTTCRRRSSASSSRVCPTGTTGVVRPLSDTQVVLKE